MDILEESWYGQIQISGTGAVINESGSVFELLRSALTQLKTAPAPRAGANGKRIVFVLQQTPFGEDKVSLEYESKVTEVIMALPTDGLDESKPQEGEDAAKYSERLDSLGFDPVTVSMLVADWFDESPSDELAQALRWINDPKAQRFRLLNASQSAYEEAMPQEYDSLQHYVMSEYPDQCKRITFRVAR